MSQSNIELARQGYAAFMRGDVPGVLELLTDDIQWVVHSPVEAGPEGGQHKGKAAVAEWFRTVGEHYELRSLQPGRVYRLGR
jgi:ketosteroid isomerase-like protein